MTDPIVFAIEEECPDSFYGYFVSELFHELKDAEERIKELKELNKGINYRLTTWIVN